MLLKKSLYFFTKFSPYLSAKLALKVLFKPNGRRAYKFRTKISSKNFRVNTQSGILSLHRFSKKQGQKSVLLSHGWADSSTRFTQVIDYLSENNFDVWTIDHIGHGQSEKNTANIFTFIDGAQSSLDFITKKYNEPIALIGHSMGSIALLNLPEEILKTKKVIMISAPTKFFESIFKRIDKAGIPKLLLLNSFKYLSRKYKKNWEELSPEHQKHKIDQNFLFIHDKGDPTCSFENIQGLVKDQKHEFVATENLGHLKILKDQTVLDSILNFIKK